MQLRILCLDQFESLGGAQQCLLDLLPFLNRQGCKTEVVMPGPGVFADKLHGAGCTLRFFGTSELSRKTKRIWEAVPYCLALRRAAITLSESVCLQRPDLLYVNGPRFLPAASWVASRYNLPLLFHAHNRLIQKSALVLAGKALQSCRSLVIACCEFVASSLRPYVPGPRLRVVSNGTADFHLHQNIFPRSIRTIGVLGRIAPEKGQLNFVRAARKLLASHAYCRFVIVGAPSGEHCDYYCRVMNESKNLDIQFTGWKDDVSSALSALDLLVVPSLSYDAAPRVILEAFSAGVPVLACPSGGIPELIEDNLTGFLTSGTEPDQIAGRIAEVLRMPAPRVQLVAANAREAWIRNYTLAHYCENVWKAVLSCVEAPLPMSA
jgi:glycosyltransferase involved in cell wall biosynthesis